MDAKLHDARQVFPYPAGKEQSRRRDLAQVRGNCFRSFRKVDLHAGDEMRRETKSLLCEPGHGAKGQPIIRLPAVDVVIIQGMPINKLIVRHLGEFGQAGRAGGHAQHDGVHCARRARQSVKHARLLLSEVSANRLNARVTGKPLIRIGPHAAVFPIYDLENLRNRFSYFQ